MRRQHAIFMLIVLSISLLVAPEVSAQAAPRAVPTNDDFANAKPITIGKNYTVLDISAATIDPGQPNVTSCGAGIIYHSVWFSILVPNLSDSSASAIYLSTEGTALIGSTEDLNNTVIAVFSGNSIGALVQVGCNSDSELVVDLSPNTAYYVMAGTFSSAAFDPSSVLKLNTRMKKAVIQTDNYNFELPLTAADWIVKNSTGDAPICGNVTYPAYTGVCAFRFVGNADEASKLKQTLPFPSVFIPRKNGLLSFVLAYRVQDAALGSAKVKFRVTYSDGTPTSTQTANLTGTAPMGSYAFVVKNIYLASSKVASVSILVPFKSTVGTLMIDFAYVQYIATASTRDAALPAPLAAQTK